MSGNADSEIVVPENFSRETGEITDADICRGRWNIVNNGICAIKHLNSLDTYISKYAAKV